MPVPSIFFIGKNGVPLEIGTSAIKSAEELLEKVSSVLAKFRAENPVSISQQPNSSAASQDPPKPKEPEPKIDTPPSTSSADENFEVVCENGVCYKKPIEKKSEATLEEKEETPVATQTSPKTENSSTETDEKVKRAMELIERKKKEKADEEARVRNGRLI